MKKTFPRCVAQTRHHTQCGRRVSDGSNPPICHIHQLQQKGGATSGLIPADDEIDELKILKKLARDSNPQVRLRAVDLLLSLKAKPPADASRNYDDLIAQATDAQRARLQDLIEKFTTLKADILAARDTIPPPEAPASPPTWGPSPPVPPPVATVPVQTAPDPAPPDPETWRGNSTITLDEWQAREERLRRARH